jgi:hypothetical protein
MASGGSLPGPFPSLRNQRLLAQGRADPAVVVQGTGFNLFSFRLIIPAQ